MRVERLAPRTRAGAGAQGQKAGERRGSCGGGACGAFVARVRPNKHALGCTVPWWGTGIRPGAGLNGSSRRRGQEEGVRARTCQGRSASEGRGSACTASVSARFPSHSFLSSRARASHTGHTRQPTLRHTLGPQADQSSLPSTPSLASPATAQRAQALSFPTPFHRLARRARKRSTNVRGPRARPGVRPGATSR